MDSIAGLFNEVGWLANGIGIVIPVIAGAIGVYKWAWPKLRPKDPFELINSKNFPNWTASLAMPYATIAIVDDQPQDFPVKELQAAGYKVESFKQVQLSDVDKLSGFDVVFLDMKGIVKDDPEYGGLKLISHLRNKKSTQKICAVSNKTFDPTATEFFKKADKTKKKPLTAQECAAVIDEFFDELFNPHKTITKIKINVEKMPQSTKSGLYRDIKLFLDRKDESVLKSKLAASALQPALQQEIINTMRAIANVNP